MTSHIPSLKLTARPWKWMVGRWNLLSGCPIWRGYVSCWYRAVAPVYFPRKQMPELVGWGGGVGWVGDDDVLCTCTHVTCYATAGVVGWGGLGMMTFFALAHMWHATQLLGWWGGVGWGWWRSLHLHTCDMLRNCWGGGVGWVGDDDVLCICTHATCYATAGVVGWGPAWFHWSFVCFVNLAALTFFVFRLGTQWIGEMFSAWGVCKAFIPKQIKKKIKQKGRTVQNPLYKTRLFQWVWRRNLVETGVKTPQEFLAKLGLACTWQE